MDRETEAPIDELEAYDAIEDEEQIVAAARVSSGDPLAC